VSSPIHTTAHVCHLCTWKTTDIGCQCSDFLQTGVLRKHIRSSALYIEELRKHEDQGHLPEMVFATRQEARIRCLHASRVTTSTTASSETAGEDDSSESDEDAEDDKSVHSSQDDMNDDMDGNISEHTTSQGILGEMERIFCIQEPCPAEVPTQRRRPASARSPLEPRQLEHLSCPQTRS
jgi:hypothetical protein